MKCRLTFTTDLSVHRCVLRYPSQYLIHYRLQQKFCPKWGDVCPSACWDTPPLLGRHAPWTDTPPLSDASYYWNVSGMHSCLMNVLATITVSRDGESIFFMYLKFSLPLWSRWVLFHRSTIPSLKPSMGPAAGTGL